MHKIIKFYEDSDIILGDVGGISGGTTDNTTDTFIPVKSSTSFENSPLHYDSGVDEVISDSIIRATIVAPTGSFAFEDTTILKTNTDTLEIEDKTRNELHEIIGDTFDDNGSIKPFHSEKSILTEFEIQLLEDEQSNSFNVTFPTLNDVLWKQIIVKPRESGVGTFTVRDTNSSGVVLNTETTFNVEISDIDTELVIDLENRIKLFAGQDVWVMYSGPALAGHDYGAGFLPFVKTRSWPFINKSLAYEEDIIDVTLGGTIGDTTDDTLDLIGQELTVNAVTQTTDGAMIANDKLKLDNISDNGTGDHWVSGLAVTEADPKNQTVDYTAGTYLINGIMQTIVSSGNYNLESGYGGLNHYSDLTTYQHRFVMLYVDIDTVIKSVGGAPAYKEFVPDLPIVPVDSVPIALIEVRVNSVSTPKDIRDKEITDTRNAPAYNTDEFVRVSADDLGAGYLSDKLTNNGSVTFTVENVGGIETIKADASGGASTPEYGELYTTTTGTQYLNTAAPIIWDTAGISSGITVDSLTNRITIYSAGAHRIEFNCSAFVERNENYNFYIYVNGVQAANLGDRFSSVASIIEGFSFSRILSLSAGDYVEIYGAATALTEFYMSPGAAFNITKL